MSKANLRVGNIMQVSWPAIDRPFTGYPSISIAPFVFSEPEREPGLSFAVS